MSKVNIYDYNANYIKILSDDKGLYYTIRDRFTYTLPYFIVKHKKSFKNGSWDGKIRFFNMKNKTINRGFLRDVLKICKELDVKITYIDESLEMEYSEDVEIKKELLEYLKSLKGVLKYKIRKYQAIAFIEAVRNYRKTLVCPTSSGKTFILYLILRFYIENVLEDSDKCLVIVPSITLIQQTFKELCYEYDNDEIFLNKIHLLYSGKEKKTKKQIIISTYQSLMREEEDYFKKFKMVVVDEVHHLNDESTGIRKILEKCNNAYFRVGMTGSLSDIETAKLVVMGFFGEIKDIISTKDLQDKGYISKSKIYICNFKYNNYYEVVRQMKLEKDFNSEIDFIVKFKPRNRKIIEIMNKYEGNKMLLFNRVNHGKNLKKYLEEFGIKYYFIDGKTTPDEREDIRIKMEKEDNAVLLASWQCAGTGYSIKKLMYVVFCSTYKSPIKNVQAIGRGLRLHPDKDTVKIIDFVDDMRLDGRKKGSRAENFLYKHSIKRQELYFKKNFDYKVTKNIEL